MLELFQGKRISKMSGHDLIDVAVKTHFSASTAHDSHETLFQLARLQMRRSEILDNVSSVLLAK